MGDTKIKFKPSIQRRLICAFKTVLIICRLAHNGAAQDFEGTIKLIKVPSGESLCGCAGVRAQRATLLGMAYARGSCAGDNPSK